MRELKKTEIERLKILYKKIDSLQATQADLSEYEIILKNAGFTQEKIRSVMTENGFNSFDDYINASKNPITEEQKMIISSVVKAFFIGLALVVFAWVIKGVVRTVNE
jgi:hypothetical protein